MAGYVIGSEKGKQIANSMKAGSTYKASDGSTWKKNSDGSVSVTTKNGGYTANALSGSSNSSTSSKGSSSSGSNNVVKVNSNGKAPSGLSVGTIVQTGGGNFKITGVNKDGSYQSQKITSSNISNSNSSIGKATTPTTVKVNANGKAPSGLKVGTIVETAGGNFEITGVNSDGSYQSRKVNQGNQVASANTPTTNQRTAVTYQQNGKTKNGYVVNGTTYDAETNKPVSMGAIVTIGNKKYFKTEDGGMDLSNGYETAVQQENDDGVLKKVGNAVIINGKAYDSSTGKRLAVGDIVADSSNNLWQMDENTGKGVLYTPTAMQELIETPITEEEYLQNSIDALMGLITDSPSLENALTWEQALARAQGTMNPTYNSAINEAMDQLDKNALKSGFYGQLPTEALKRNTAGNLEVQKLQAINELATQLFGQSEESAYKALSAATEEQQNKINSLLNLLGIYQTERAYRDSRADEDYNKKLQEANYTGYYNGKPTLDMLNFNRLNSK